MLIVTTVSLSFSASAVRTASQSVITSTSGATSITATPPPELCPLSCIVFSIGLFYSGNWMAFGGEDGGLVTPLSLRGPQQSFGGVVSDFLFVVCPWPDHKKREAKENKRKQKKKMERKQTTGVLKNMTCF